MCYSYKKQKQWRYNNCGSDAVLGPLGSGTVPFYVYSSQRCAIISSLGIADLFVTAEQRIGATATTSCYDCLLPSLRRATVACYSHSAILS